MKLKILLLGDGQNHIVDRICREYMKRIPFEFEFDNYCTLTASDFAKKANDFDLIHFNNWDVVRQMSVFGMVNKPMIMSVRSFRYPEKIKLVIPFFKKILVIHPEMLPLFKNSAFIPDATSDSFVAKPFVVGCAYQSIGGNEDYKGIGLIKEACRILGCEFRPVSNVPFEEMPFYYEGIDLYICASENEGFGAPVVECMKINKPVITTDVGIAKYYPVTKVERSVEGIMAGISRYYTSPQVASYNWDTVCNSLKGVYEEVYARTQR